MHGSDPDWTVTAVRTLYDLPLPDLVFRAQAVHREHHDPRTVQLCALVSVKTGGCSEDCGYCAQSARWWTGVEPSRLLEVDDVLSRARAAKLAGATRLCMGAAWREVRDGAPFERVLEMVRGVRALGLEACATLGMVTEEQATRLREAGLTAYNHNLDTSAEFYREVITTRTQADRRETLANVSRAGISVCSGGIIGMGESVDDRCAMLATLANLDPPPESVPVNALVPIEGTPLAARPRVDAFALVRMCAAARIVLPRARVRLSAGRTTMTHEAQMLCFLAGANSIFFGEKLLTTGNPGTDEDLAFLEAVGMKPEA